MREIPLTRGMVALVDDEDYASIAQHKWCAHKCRDRFYAARYENGRYVYMHRVIAGASSGTFVDHKDGSGLNNCRLNLRSATRTQNAANGRKYRRRKVPCSSQFRGVYFSKWAGLKRKWLVRISVDRKARHVGCFATEIEAAIAYNAAARLAYGEFAYQNDVAGSSCA